MLEYRQCQTCGYTWDDLDQDITCPYCEHETVALVTEHDTKYKWPDGQIWPIRTIVYTEAGHTVVDMEPIIK